jgi:hypothetical protein
MREPMTGALIGGFLLLSSAAGWAAPAEELLAAHAACDGSEFAVLAKHADQFADKMPILRKDVVATIPVPDRREKGQRTVRFRAGLPAFDVTVIGFSDEYDAYGPELQFLFWGFLAKEDVATVARALMPHVPNSDRMKRDSDGNFVRLEVFDGERWRDVPDPLAYAGIPGQFVERAYIIERSKDPRFPGTRISCSLQGPVGKWADVLPTARPDLR